MTGLRYVYAVCRPFDAPLQAQLTGVGGAPPKLLRHHGLVAVVSTVPERDFGEEPLRAHLQDPVWLGRTARAHGQVVDALTAVTTPLPLRPATVFPDDSGVRVMIEQSEDRLRRTLDRLQGRVEWGVMVYAGAGRRAAAERFAERLHEKLSAHAESARLRLPQHSAASDEENFLNAAYLVPRADSEEFVEIVDRAKTAETDPETGIRVELTGPWAAYSFVEGGEAGD